MLRFLPFFLLSIPALAAGPRTVPAVELGRYLGLWIEVARLPNSFQDGITKDGFSPCMSVTARYGLLPDGKISVDNRCRRENEAGMVKYEQAVGKARVVRGSHGAKLKVNFTGSSFLEWLGIGDGNYWVMELGPVNKDGLYSYALVGEPGRKNAWILSRTKNLPPEIVEALLNHLDREGFDTSVMVFD